MKSSRDWRKKTILISGKPYEGWRFRCPCGKDAALKWGLGAKTAAVMVPRKMKERGWAVGGKPEDDRCPECAAPVARNGIEISKQKGAT
jgi:hypothetical protein